jgi:hypothetical protein
MSNLKEQAMKDIKKRIEMRMCNWCSDSRVCVRERPCGYFSEHAQEWVDLIEQWLSDSNYYPIQADSEGLATNPYSREAVYIRKDSGWVTLFDAFEQGSKAQKALCDKEKEEALLSEMGKEGE